MNIVLISPPTVSRRADLPPIGLAYIATILRKERHNVKCIDAFNLTYESLKDRIMETEPDIVGISCWTIGREQAFKTSSIVREYSPASKIVMGGQHATLLAKQILEAGYADFIVLGEGEETVVELVRSLEESIDFSTVRGLAYKSGNDVIINARRPLISDLDTVPFPCYDDFSLNEYAGLPWTGRRVIGIITSRGCPFNCDYCSSTQFWTRKWRYRSAENVLSEIDDLYVNREARAIVFYDDNFTTNKDRVIQICKGIIQRKLDLVWAASSNVRSVDQEILDWMKRAGCHEIRYGVESGSPLVLKSINKSQTADQIRNAFRWTRQAGIRPHAYLMVGCPGETSETINDTISLMREIAPKQRPSALILWVLPGTEIYNKAKLQGIISDDSWLGNDDEFFYTVEHSVEELRELQAQLLRGLARNNGILALLLFLLRNKLKNVDGIYKLCRSIKRYGRLLRQYFTGKVMFMKSRCRSDD